MARRTPPEHALALALVALGLPLLAAPATADAKLRPAPAEGVPGTTVEIRGVKGKVTRVTVGGRKAAVVRTNPLRVVVPSVSPGRQPVVVHIRRGRSRAGFKVLAVFRGRFKAVPDSARADTTTVGTAGGTVTATGRDGTSFQLAVPAGALAADTAIKLTPLRSVSGLPGRELAGVRMEPPGTKFTEPATLTIRRRQATRETLVALHGHSNGTGAKWVATAKRGRTISLRVRHFSDAAMNAANAAAYAQLLEESGTGDLSEEDVSSRMDSLLAYEAVNPGSCAQQLALCSQAKQLLAARVDTLAVEVRLNISEYRAIADLTRLEVLRSRVATHGDYTIFKNEILVALINAAGPEAGQTPHFPSGPAIVGLGADDYSAADLDASLTVSHLEWVRLLWRAAVRENTTQAATVGEVFLRHGLVKQRNDGQAMCLAGNSGGASRLTSGLAVARASLVEQVSAYDEAIAQCGVVLSVTPGEVTVSPGSTVQFAYSGRPGETVTWSADTGSISAAGLYTAPEAPGTSMVTATSSLSPSRTARATVNVQTPPFSFELINRLDLLETKARASGVDDDEDLSQSPPGFTPFDGSIQSNAVGADSEGHGAASQKSTLEITGGRLRIHVEGTLSASAILKASTGAPEASGRADNLFFARFKITGESAPYTLTGTLQDPTDESGYFSVDFRDEYGMHLSQSSSDTADSLSGSGTLAPGEYILELDGRVFATLGHAHTGSFDLTLTVG